ncbi:hypothetical protein Tco_1312222 [Tanacetum coccineum]
MMTYLKHVGGKKHSDLKTKTFEEIHVLYERLKRQDQNFVAIRSAEDERQIKELNKDTKKKRLKKRVVKETPREEDTAKVHAEQEVTEQDIKKRKSGHYLEITPKDIELILWGDLKIMMESLTEENDQELKDGTVIYMLVERRYPLSKELLQRMLDLGLEIEEESIDVLQLVKRLEKIVKSSKARTRAKIVVSGDEEDVDDTSKLGNSMIEDVDQYAGVTLVQIDAEDQGSVAKVLADAARVHTYTRRRRTVSTSSGGISTASRLISTAKESVSIVGASMPVSTAGMVQESIPSPRATKDKGKAIMQESKQPKKIKKRVQIQMSLDEELAQKLHEEEQARFNAEQEVKINAEQEELLASEVTDEEANPSVSNVDWDDVQAQIQVDEDLAQIMLEKEKESLSITERERLLAELIDKRKKLQAA